MLMFYGGTVPGKQEEGGKEPGKEWRREMTRRITKLVMASELT